MSMNELEWENKACELLYMVISAARNGLPYKQYLRELKIAMEHAPLIRKAVVESLSGTYND